LESAREEIKTLDISRYDRIWRIRKKEKDAVMGRIRFDIGDFISSMVELTMAKEYRNIDKTEIIKGGYVRLEKSELESSYKIVESRIAPGDERLLDKVEGFKKAFSLYRKRMLDFATLVKSAGGNCVSFDFVNVGNTMEFPDFDTDNEKMVINKLLKKTTLKATPIKTLDSSEKI